MQKNEFLDHKKILEYWEGKFRRGKSFLQTIADIGQIIIEVGLSEKLNPVFGIRVPEFHTRIDKQIGSLHLYTGYIGESDTYHFFIEFNDYNKRLYFSVFCSALFTELRDMPAGVSVFDCIINFCNKWKDYFKDPSDPFTVGVLGEMIVYSKLLQIAPGSVIWNLAHHSTKDFFVSPNIEIEVKTISRHYGYIVGIHGENQLQISPGKRLFIAFVRLEGVAGKGDYSIDKLLTKLSIQDEDIQKELMNINVKNRARTYNLKELLFIEVTKDFPCITSSTLMGINEYSRISNVSYDLDLSDMTTLSLGDFSEKVMCSYDIP